MKTTKNRVNKLEKDYARKNNMTKCLASGATDWGKGDCVDEVFMVDLKTTIAKTQTTIKISDLQKAYEDAITYNPPRIPVIHLDISGFECDVLFSRDFNWLKELALDKYHEEKS